MSDNLIRDADKNADILSELPKFESWILYLYTITRGKTKIKLARSLRLPLLGPEFESWISYLI